jgi:glycosyltransferase involved in cell wall biosynthesis
MSRRILHIVATLDRSGAEKQLVLLASQLPRDQFDVHVCAITRGGPLADELRAAGIPVTVIGKRLKIDPLAFDRLRRHIAEVKPELVHTWMFTANAYGRAAALLAGVPHVVASERCVDPWKDWHQLALDRFLARRTDAIVVNSRGVQQFYVENGLPAGKMRLIYNGVQPAPASGVTRAALLSELGLPLESRLIGAVGRLWPQKRIKDLIWATDLLKVIRDDVHLLIIGDGPQRQALERFTRLCHVDTHVHFLGTRHDVPRLMPHFDLLWLASGYEGMPNVVMEAMAAAVPVVATDIWGNRELVVHGHTGFLVAVGDRAGLARFAHKILEDRELAQRLGAAGQQRMSAEFSVEAMVAKHAALYRELLGGS